MGARTLHPERAESVLLTVVHPLEFIPAPDLGLGGGATVAVPPATYKVVPGIVALDPGGGVGDPARPLTTVHARDGYCGPRCARGNFAGALTSTTVT